ncbi:hypothetical protein [Nitratireductor sp. GCM10026969]|uniref:hypothetical protein n=1 Tax=Nitratireductor sp. GCM10026969 TaxID=3252645 RepID=UPI0036088654
MTQGFIYMVDPDGGLKRMTPSAPDNEDSMQALVSRYPELITDGDGELLLIRREQTIADNEDGASRWSLDHLFVTRDAVPVLVELKRAVDTRLRREVVGQMLDYAANATAYWQAGRIADSFTRTAVETGTDPDTALQEFIGEQDPATFWEQVDANFKAGRIKLVFVADEIPRELARIVEFLNDQMRADVRAVELRWFAGEGDIITLSPRIIGETERTAVAKRSSAAPEPISRDQWLQKHMSSDDARTLAGARAFIAVVEGLGGVADVSSRQGSIYAAFTGSDGKVFYPLHLWAEGALVSFTLRFLHQRSALQDEGVRRRLLDGLIQIVGPLTTMNIKGYPSFKVDLLADPNILPKVEAWLASALDQMR